MHDHYVDIYCERTAQGLLNEPLNLISNLAFFIAAYFVFRLMRQNDGFRPAPIILLVLLVCIGIGSSAFHAFATYPTMAMDTIPILLFQIVFVSAYTYRVIGGEKAKFNTAFLLLIFVAASLFFGRLPYEWVNGSLGYVPAMLFLFGFGIYHYKTQKKDSKILLLAAATFLVSLTFRSIDNDICEFLPIGVHYFWHILNSAVLYMAMRALVRNYSTRTEPE